MKKFKVVNWTGNLEICNVKIVDASNEKEAAQIALAKAIVDDGWWASDCEMQQIYDLAKTNSFGLYNDKSQTFKIKY